MTTINVQTPCGPAIAEFDGDRFIRATGEDGKVLLTVPVAMIDGWREVLRERGRAVGLVRRLRDALEGEMPSYWGGESNARDAIAEADAYLAAHDAPAPQPAPAPNAPAVDIKRLADALYSAGYRDADKERNYDLRATHEWQAVAALSGPTAPAPAQVDDSAGIARAAAYIQKKADDYAEENCGLEHDTNAVSYHYGQAGEEYHHTLIELAEEVAALAQQPGAQPPTLPPVTNADAKLVRETFIRKRIERYAGVLQPPAAFDPTADDDMRAALESYRASLATPEPQS